MSRACVSYWAYMLSGKLLGELLQPCVTLFEARTKHGNLRMQSVSRVEALDILRSWKGRKGKKNCSREEALYRATAGCSRASDFLKAT